MRRLLARHAKAAVRAALAAGVLLATPVAVRAAEPAGFSIEQVLSAPIASGLTAAPAAGRFAWLVDLNGARNIWIAEPGPDGLTSRALTHYEGDDGYQIGDVDWTPSADAVVYARGSQLRGSHALNLLSAPQGMTLSEVWIAPWDGRPPRRIGDGHEPRVSPRGDAAAFLSSDGKIMLGPLDGSVSPAPLLRDLGEDDDLRWSPDGSKLAFVSRRANWSFVGIYDIAAKTVTWMSPGFDADSAPLWSPDGAHLAFVRSPVRSFKAHGSRPAGQPWSIWVADPETGRARQVFLADTGPGSVFFGLASGSQSLIWAAGDRIVFPWEKTGWLNLYSVGLDGGRPAPVAAGPFEVFAAALEGDGRAIVYSANRGDLDGRRLWRAPVAGAGGAPVTRSVTLQDTPVVSSDGRTVAFMEGDARRPFEPVALAGGREQPIASAPAPADFPGSRFVTPRVVTFTAPDGLPLHGQLFEPPARPGRARGPAILFFHGGPKRQMLPGWGPTRFYAEAYAMNQFLASRGYVVLSVNYRGGTGYGLKFREPDGFGPAGASEAQDVRAAALYLAALPNVDAKRIGAYGGSYGGLMTALGLSRDSDLLAAGVDYAGIHDWRAEAPEFLRPDAPPGAAETAWRSSALAHVSTWTSPVLVAHADDDRSVPFDQSSRLVEALRAQGVPVEVLVIPNEVHDLRLHRSWLTLLHAVDDFFARRLGVDRR